MAEYIEKGALMSHIESEARRWGFDYDYWQVLADVEDFPVADVRPTVRGMWEIDDEGYVRCGVCHQKTPLYNIELVELTDYCPHCGADMR